jgi:hypothetical protein
MKKSTKLLVGAGILGSILLALSSRKLHQALCRHRSDMLVGEPGRLYLQCLDCGRKTRGWEIGRKV